MTEDAPKGGRLNHDLPFKPVHIAVLTISDTRDEESDTSGMVLVDRIERAGHRLAARALVAVGGPDRWFRFGQ